MLWLLDTKRFFILFCGQLANIQIRDDHSDRKSQLRHECPRKKEGAAGWRIMYSEYKMEIAPKLFWIYLVFWDVQ